MRSQIKRLFQVLIPSVVLLLSGLAEAATRVALVIGNDQYVNSPMLRNAANDARGIADALRGNLGFTLIGGSAHIDLNRGQALDLLEQFRRQSEGAEIALFYFAGHGIAEAGHNWLMPSDDRHIAFREDVPLYALSQQAVLERMNGKVNVVVLDACRNNPLPYRNGGREASRGLQPTGGPRGTLVAYSAGEGEVAADGSSYTQELLKHIRTPGLRLDDLFRRVGDSVYAASKRRQNPQIKDQLRDGLVYLMPSPNPVTQLDADRLSYEAALASGSPQGWQAYLKRYPNGAYAGVAEVQLAALSRLSPSPAPAPTPTAVPAPASSVDETKDCADCPVMVRIRGGTFRMGDLSGEGSSYEKPVHEVNIRPFSVGKFEVTFAEWDSCVSVGGCSTKPRDEGWGREHRPVINVSWEDAQQYVKWLSGKTGKRYRLLTESEWEYVARAGTTTEYSWGDSDSHDYANYGRYRCCEGVAKDWDQWFNTSPAGSFPANPWGLHDVHGNVWEWTQDCWHDSYQGAPKDGSAWTSGGDCKLRVTRGGSWYNAPRALQSANRYEKSAASAFNTLGFRLAKTD